MNEQDIRREAAEKALPKFERALDKLRDEEHVLVDYRLFKLIPQDEVIESVDKQAAELGKSFQGAIYFCKENFDALREGQTAHLSFYGLGVRDSASLGHLIVKYLYEEGLNVKWPGDPCFTINVDPCPQLNQTDEN